MTITRLIGQELRSIQRSCTTNMDHVVSVRAIDKFGTPFSYETTAPSGDAGTLVFDTETIRNFISNSTPPKKAAFLIPEFDKYNVTFTTSCANEPDKTDFYEITGGIGTELEKEEWRGEIIGNVFYPKNKVGKFKPIIHINGSVQLLQDARSIMLAREGYLVLELAYNMPQLGQQAMYERSTFPLEYIEDAISKLLSHPRCYGNEVCLMGHSKGGNLALASSAEFKDRVPLTITSCCQVNAPVFTDLTYGSKRQYNTGCNPHQMAALSKAGEDGLYRLKWGMAEALHLNGKYVYSVDQNGEHQLDKDLLQKITKQGIPYMEGRNIFHFQTTSDPVISPTEKTAKEYVDTLFGDTGHTVEFLDAGHLCIVPGVPVVHEAFMSFGETKFMLDWSRNTTFEEKCKEGKEYQRFYKSVLKILERHW